jgi:hypothetical protein
MSESAMPCLTAVPQDQVLDLLPGALALVRRLRDARDPNLPLV